MTKPIWHNELLIARTATRRGVYFRGLAVILLVGFALLVHPLLAVIAGLAACLLLFRPSSCMLAFLMLAAIVPSANLAIFGRNSFSNSQMDVAYFAFLLSGLAMTIYLTTRKRLSMGRTTHVFCICAVIGSILALATSTSVSLTAIGLVKFILPVFILSVWYDNIELKEAFAKEAPYLVAGMLSGVAIVSMPLLQLGIGYEFNRVEFNGPLWHPQILGLMMIILVPAVFHLHRLPMWLRCALGFMALILAWVAMSRTALAAFVILAVFEGARLALLPTFDRWRTARQDRWALWPKLAFRLNMVTLSAIALCSLWVASGIAKTEIGADASSKILSLEGYASTRAMIIDRSFSNFQSHILTGIGFAVPSDPRLLDPEFAAANLFELKRGGEILVDPNKGNSFVAVFEENGLLTAPIWLGLFFFFVASVAVLSPAGLSIAVIVVACAFGEATIFAPTNIGLVQWIALVAMAGVGMGRTETLPAFLTTPQSKRS